MIKLCTKELESLHQQNENLYQNNSQLHTQLIDKEATILNIQTTLQVLFLIICNYIYYLFIIGITKRF